MTHRYQFSVSSLLKRAVILPCLLCMILPFAWSQTPTIGLTINGVQVRPIKAYDGTNYCEIADSGILAGVLTADEGLVHAIPHAYYVGTSNVGDNIPVSIIFTLEGPRASAYSLDTIYTTTASIRARQLTITSPTIIDTTKPFDQNTIAAIQSKGTMEGIVNNEPVDFHAHAFYLDANAGIDKDVVINYTIYDLPHEGTNVYNTNYVAPENDTVKADILPLQLGIANVAVVQSKVYDNTTYAMMANIGRLQGVLPGDSSTVLPDVVSANFDDKNVGENKPVNIIFNIHGINAHNYAAPLPMTLYASITPKPITIDSVEITPSKIYNGSRLCPIVRAGVLNGVYPEDTVTNTVLALYDNANVGENKPVTIEHVLGGPQFNNYMLPDTEAVHYDVSTITPAHLTASGADVKKVKQFNGDDTAYFVFYPVIDTMIEGYDVDRTVAGRDTYLRFPAANQPDTVKLIANAHFNDATVEDNKTIVVTYELEGPQAGNYIKPTGFVYCTDGRIISATRLAVLDDATGAELIPTAEGYCQATMGGIQFQVVDGEPLFCKVDFSDEANAQGFVDIPWTVIPDDDIIPFAIPATCKEGKYTANVTFLNEADSVLTRPVSFFVNLSNAYLVQIFCDVISVDNSGILDSMPNRFTSFQWYHNGEQIPGANKAYYQEKGGLNGSYSLKVNMDTEDEGMICPISDFLTCPEEKVVMAYPNPVVNKCTVDLQGFDEAEHTMKVYNEHGSVVFTTTFSADTYVLDMSAMPQGTYMINVDGATAKTVKL